MDLGLSRTLAFIYGTALPLLGFVRMLTGTNRDPVGFFVDLVAGAFLLVGAWRVGVAAHSGQRYLAAAWGLTVGLLFTALYGEIQSMWVPAMVESPIPPEGVVAGISLALLGAVIGLITCLRSIRKH
jgi:hypothetical protein